METSFSLLAFTTALIVCLAFYLNVYLRGVNPAEFSRPSSATISNVSTQITRKDWSGIDAGFAKSLRSFGEPLVLQNTIAAKYPRITLGDISTAFNSEQIISSIFKHSSPVFGPFYDSFRPMHRLASVRGSAPYQTDATLSVKDLEAAFRANGPPYYHLSIQPEELGIPLFNITELVSLHPQKSSVNLWLGMKGGTTPCHYDGYHNMYVQLSGQKRFILYPPDRMASMGVYPFLHPSYGQCSVSLNDLSWRQRNWREVTLRPGELLYIPPFWLHQVVGESPSVAINVWTGIDDEAIFEEILSIPIPGLEQPYDAGTDPYAESDPLAPTFRPHFPLITKELGILQTRLVLGAFVSFEIIHRADVKNLLTNSIADAYARYLPLMRNGTLEHVPKIVEESLSRTIDQWLPKPPVLNPAVWGMSVASKEMGSALTRYSYNVSVLLKKMSSETLRVWSANYIEAVAFQVGGVQKASWLIDLIGKKNEREEARKIGPN